jgi:hypothetical protein
MLRWLFCRRGSEIIISAGIGKGKGNGSYCEKEAPKSHGEAPLKVTKFHITQI